MPRTQTAFDAGVLSWSQVRGIVVEARPLSVAQRGVLDDALAATVAQGRERGEPDRVVEICGDIAARLDAVGQDLLEDLQERTERLVMQFGFDGWADVYGTLGPVTAATVAEALDAAADTPASPTTAATDDGPTDDGPTDDGPTDDGPTDDGPTDDGPTDDGPTDDGPTDDGPTDDGPTDDSLAWPGGPAAQHGPGGCEGCATGADPIRDEGWARGADSGAQARPADDDDRPLPAVLRPPTTRAGQWAVALERIASSYLAGGPGRPARPPGAACPDELSVATRYGDP